MTCQRRQVVTAELLPCQKWFDIQHIPCLTEKMFQQASETERRKKGKKERIH